MPPCLPSVAEKQSREFNGGPRYWAAVEISALLLSRFRGLFFGSNVQPFCHCRQHFEDGES